MTLAREVEAGAWLTPDFAREISTMLYTAKRRFDYWLRMKTKSRPRLPWAALQSLISNLYS